MSRSVLASVAFVCNCIPFFPSSEMGEHKKGSVSGTGTYKWMKLFVSVVFVQFFFDLFECVCASVVAVICYVHLEK